MAVNENIVAIRRAASMAADILENPVSHPLGILRVTIGNAVRIVRQENLAPGIDVKRLKTVCENWQSSGCRVDGINETRARAVRAALMSAVRHWEANIEQFRQYVEEFNELVDSLTNTSKAEVA